MSLRNLSVVVAVVHDEQKRFLVCFNERWHGYVFPMKKARPGMDLALLAVEALQSGLGWTLRDASATPLEYVGLYGYSHGVDEDTYYDYHVFEVDPGLDLSRVNFGDMAVFLAYDELVQLPGVTWPAKDIARSLVEDQDVILAVISREVKSKGGGSENEFLMIRKTRYHGFFFPVIRWKTEADWEQMAVAAVQSDTGYTGQIEATWRRDVEHQQYSPRYERNRRFAFHVCKIELPDVDLQVPGNPLEAALEAVVPDNGDPEYWGWFTEEQLRNPKNMSPTVEAVRLTVIQCAE